MTTEHCPTCRCALSVAQRPPTAAAAPFPVIKIDWTNAAAAAAPQTVSYLLVDGAGRVTERKSL